MVGFRPASAAMRLASSILTLATVSSGGQPSARTVLLKYFDETGFVFYTNYESAKGRELTDNPGYWK